MLATSELMRTTGQLARVDKLLPSWLELPIYRAAAEKEFSRWPLISKRDLRENFPGNFLRGGQSLDALLASKSIELEHTSGSSDERTPVLFRRGWWNIQENCMLRLNHYISRVLEANPFARRATLVPPVCNGLVCFSNYTAKSARTVEATLFVNQARIPFLLTEAEMARMADEILEWSPEFLDLDPVHGAWFAIYCERKGLVFPSVQFLLCSYEFVSVVHRNILQRVFGRPIFNLYGSTETGHLLFENEHGEMKDNPENVFYEIIDPDERGIGELVVTTLTNDIMPLVRYRVGDLVSGPPHSDGANYQIHGRVRDALRRWDGQRVTTLDIDRCFDAGSGIIHYQMRQDQTGNCDLQYIADHQSPDAADIASVTERIENLLQLRKKINAMTVQKLPPLTSGKFRLTGRLAN